MNIKPSELAKLAEISVPYASQILNGIRSPSREKAFAIHEKTGLCFGPLVGLTAEQIGLLRDMGQAA